MTITRRTFLAGVALSLGLTLADVDARLIQPTPAEIQVKSGPIAPHTLVAYKGGGYNGCFWEWNYAYIDEHGEFHDVYSSGRRGCQTEAQLHEAYDYFLKKKASLDGRALSPYSMDDFDLYALCDLNELRRVGRELPVDHLIMVANWFIAEGREDVDFVTICSYCNEEQSVVEAVGSAYHGAGGVHIEAGSIACRDCCNRYTCYECGEFVGPSNISDKPNIDPCDIVCVWCAREEAEPDTDVDS